MNGPEKAGTDIAMQPLPSVLSGVRVDMETVKVYFM